jgi:anhydro-N-acetylmuramic acid kinase
MRMQQTVWAMGLMSGTSLDGVDAALIRTDGEKVYEFGPAITVPYSDALSYDLREAVYRRSDIARTARDLTMAHNDVVHELLRDAEMKFSDVAYLGFHGQSIDHRPDEGITVQIGDPAMLAENTGIDVIADFRRRDIACGGQGAPLVPLYHAALVRDMDLPIVVLNIGGIANVTWVGRASPQTKLSEMDILAFDTGPGNVLLNEWAGLHTGTFCDKDGKLSLEGEVDQAVVAHLLEDEYFAQKPPKSLDRNHFDVDAVQHFSSVDGAATLAAFTISSILKAREFLPQTANHWVVAGGGRHNPALVRALKQRIPGLQIAEEIGWDGDALEAQAFAFLAVRSAYGLPLTLPTTTGTNRPVTGGALYRAHHELQKIPA